MKNFLIAFLVGIVVAGLAGYIYVNQRSASVITLQDDGLGGTQIEEYIKVGKQSLKEQTKFLAATITRAESFTREIKKERLGVKSTATVLVSYQAEYSFGYDFQNNAYDIQAGDKGLEIVLHQKPVLVTTPALKNKQHKILNTGWFVNEESEIIAIYEGMDNRLLAAGWQLAKDEAVIALCEKKLIAFWSDFLAKQPGVKVVPHIAIRYQIPDKK